MIFQFAPNRATNSPLSFVYKFRVCDVVKKNSPLIEFVKDTIRADSQSELSAPLKSVVRKGFQACSHVIDLAPDRIAYCYRQRIECS